MNIYKAKNEEIDEIFQFYKEIIEYMDTYGIKLGWKIDEYPNYDFVKEMVNSGYMYVMRDECKIICSAAINHSVNPEYNDIDWIIKEPEDKIATVHALAVSPKYRSKNISDSFLNQIEELCRENGDLAIHFDVIHFNRPAYKLYIRNGYKDHGAINMYYDVVGTQKFNMMEKVL